MIYLFAGDDTKNKYKTYEKFSEKYLEEMAVFNISRNSFDPMQIESFYSGAGLFFAKCAVIFDGILEREDERDFILEKLELLGKSNNDFIFLESKLTKAIIDDFRKARAQLNVFELPKEKKEKYDNFKLAWDFADRDKLKLWIHFREAMDVGVGMEELVGVLFWKAKDMLLKKDFHKFSEEELKHFVMAISYLLPKARNEGLDDEAVFEQFLLEAL